MYIAYDLKFSYKSYFRNDVAIKWIFFTQSKQILYKLILIKQKIDSGLKWNMHWFANSQHRVGQMLSISLSQQPNGQQWNTCR